MCPDIQNGFNFQSFNRPIHQIRSAISIWKRSIFSDSLDYCWYYGGTVGNRENMDKIPNIDETYILIASFVYYDKTRLRQVKNSKYTPKKNEMNIGYVGSHFEALPKSDKHIFTGNEYVINDLN
jgi:hypothetical protein